MKRVLTAADVRLIYVSAGIVTYEEADQFDWEWFLKAKPPRRAPARWWRTMWARRTSRRLREGRTTVNAVRAKYGLSPIERLR